MKQTGTALSRAYSRRYDEPTWVDGIGPPLEQLEEDHAENPIGRISMDVLALIAEVKHLRERQT